MMMITPPKANSPTRQTLTRYDSYRMSPPCIFPLINFILSSITEDGSCRSRTLLQKSCFSENSKSSSNSTCSSEFYQQVKKLSSASIRKNESVYDVAGRVPGIEVAFDLKL